MVNDLRGSLYSHLQRLSLAFHSRQQVGDTGDVRPEDEHQARPGAGAITPRRPFPLFNDIAVTMFRANSSYNGLQTTVERRLSKDEILERYLNTIYFGRGAYGIETAAKAYFGKDASQLDLGQAAVLASVINAPSLYDPANGAKAQDNLKNRVSYVLDGMVTEGWLKPADRATVTGPPQTIPPQKSQALTGPNGYIVAAVRNELTSTLKLEDSDIDRGGIADAARRDACDHERSEACEQVGVGRDQPTGRAEGPVEGPAVAVVVVQVRDREVAGARLVGRDRPDARRDPCRCRRDPSWRG